MIIALLRRTRPSSSSSRSSRRRWSSVWAQAALVVPRERRAGRPDPTQLIVWDIHTQGRYRGIRCVYMCVCVCVCVCVGSGWHSSAPSESAAAKTSFPADADPLTPTPTLTQLTLSDPAARRLSWMLLHTHTAAAAYTQSLGCSLLSSHVMCDIWYGMGYGVWYGHRFAAATHRAAPARSFRSLHTNAYTHTYMHTQHSFDGAISD